MVDDHWDARPQSGFTEASVVWQAPAEGGIPRYMMIFAEGSPKSVGPVRSARLYFVQWASEWKAVYAHVGGSPQAMASWPRRGRARWSTTPTSSGTAAPTSGGRPIASRPTTSTPTPSTCAPLPSASGPPIRRTRPSGSSPTTLALAARPKGARIDITYPYNKIGYRYDRASNTWRRYTGGKAQVDRANKKQVAPKNVVIMQVRFGLLGAHQKGRLEAQNIGTGPAWIATNGKMIKGTWKKTSATNPTRFYDRPGKAVVLTRGQTFVQVIPPGTPLKLVKGTPVVAPTPSPSPTPTPTPRRRPRHPGARRRHGRVDLARLARHVHPAPPIGAGAQGSRLGDPAVDPVVGPGRAERVGQAIRVARLDQQAGRPDDLRQGTDGAGDHRRAGGEGVEHGQPGGVAHGRVDGGAGRRDQAGELPGGRAGA